MTRDEYDEKAAKLVHPGYRKAVAAALRNAAAGAWEKQRNK